MRYCHLSLYLLWALCLFISCVDDREKLSPDQEAYAVFTPSIAGTQVATRASNNTWDKNDEVGIYMVSHNVTVSLPGLSDGNHPYKAATGGTATELVVVPGNARILYPSNGDDVNFIAYYPYSADVTTNNHIYKVDVSDQSDLPAIDLIYHKGTTAYSKNNREASLEFNHQLSKLLIQVIPASDEIAVDLTDIGGSLVGFPTTADFTLETGLLTDPGDAATTDTPIVITLDDEESSDSRALFEAIVVPTGDDGTFTRSILFEIDGESYTYAIPETTEFESGVAYSYNFKFTGNSIVLIQNTIVDWDGGVVAWNDYLLTSSKIYFDLSSHSSSDNTVTISTNAPSAPTFSLSEDADSQSASQPDWITDASLSTGTPDANGWASYTLTFDVGFNIDTEVRNGYILLQIDGLTLAIRVTQAKGEGLYVNDPSPASFEDMPYGGVTGKTFAILTNSQDTDITVSTNNSELIENLDKSRSEVVSDGSSTWTIMFDMTESTDTDTRIGDIEVRINGITKTVSVEQPGIITVDSDENCFMIKPAGGITFNPTRAKAYGGATGATTYTVAKLWDDTGAVESATINNGVGDAAVITVIPTGTPGNAVIAVCEGATIVWSYHIWVVDYDPATKNWVNNGFTFMDRNLGATKASMGSGLGTGLFYQWGRKDPFPATGTYNSTQFGGGGFTRTLIDEATGTIDYTIKNPASFLYTPGTASSSDWYYGGGAGAGNRNNTLWGHATVKSPYDPCPDGWRVPKNSAMTAATSPWYGFSEETSTIPANLDPTGFSSGYSWGTNAQYPAAGYRDVSSSTVTSVGTHGYYWTASPYTSTSSYASRLYFYDGYANANGSYYRASGLSVRCVQDN